MTATTSNIKVMEIITVFVKRALLTYCPDAGFVPFDIATEAPATWT